MALTDLVFRHKFDNPETPPNGSTLFTYFGLFTNLIPIRDGIDSPNSG